MMEERNLHKITTHLKEKMAQKRVRQNIEKGRSEATVTIGRAASLFDFSVSQLRDWEKTGLLRPMRPKESIERKNTSGHEGQRQYSFVELDKLAIIRELIQEAKLNPGAIPSNIDEIWNDIIATEIDEESAEHKHIPINAGATIKQATQPIDVRVTQAYRDYLSLRYYAARVLWLSLKLVYEDIPGFTSGIILPQSETFDTTSVTTEHLAQCGTSLVGWLGATGSFYTFLTYTPELEYPSDFSVRPLCPLEQQDAQENIQSNHTLLITQRGQIRQIHDNTPTIKTVQRLLEPLYEESQEWHTYFGEERQEIVNPYMNFTLRTSDAILTGLTKMVVRLGGQKQNGKDRWSNCWILLPRNTHLPLHQQSLTIRATSDIADSQVGLTASTPDKNSTSLSLRAYQSGHIVYRSQLSSEDTTYRLDDLEGATRSCIAIPIGGESGLPIGVLYVASLDQDAFDEDNQRVLRIITRIFEELLRSYDIRQKVSSKLGSLINDPETVDHYFEEFRSENDFFRDVDQLLANIQTQQTQYADGLDSRSPKEISFIAIDIDTDVQGRIAATYGDTTLRNVNKEIGLRIHNLVTALFVDYTQYQLYHIYAGRYYLFLQNVTLEKTKNDAYRLRTALTGSITIKQTELPSSTLKLPDISLHLGVTHYPIEKIQKPLELKASSEFVSTIYHALDLALKLCADEGGNTIMAWNDDIRTFKPLDASQG
jgi:MerR HTH family regulatory protein